jgi:hypothetical protein
MEVLLLNTHKTLAATYMILINPLKTTICFIHKHSVRTSLRFRWKVRPMKDVQGNIGCLLQESYGVYKYTVWANVEFLVLNLMVRIVTT